MDTHSNHSELKVGANIDKQIDRLFGLIATGTSVKMVCKNSDIDLFSESNKYKIAYNKVPENGLICRRNRDVFK